MSSIPEINGSSSAFLAVVITLSVFVAACCIAIFWLLKHHQPTSADRMRRRTELEAARTAENSPQKSNPRSLKARIGRAFGGKGGQWTQAPAHEEQEIQSGWRELMNRSDPSTTMAYHDSGRAEFHQNSLSTSSVQLSPPHAASLSASPSPSLIQSGPIYFPTYGEQFRRTVDSPEPSLGSPTLSTVDAYIHDPSRTLSRDLSLEGTPDNQHFWIQSHGADGNPMQMKKWNNGSRFQEGIH